MSERDKAVEAEKRRQYSEAAQRMKEMRDSKISSQQSYIDLQSFKSNPGVVEKRNGLASIGYADKDEDRR